MFALSSSGSHFFGSLLADSAFEDHGPTCTTLQTRPGFLELTREDSHHQWAILCGFKWCWQHWIQVCHEWQSFFIAPSLSLSLFLCNVMQGIVLYVSHVTHVIHVMYVMLVMVMAIVMYGIVMYVCVVMQCNAMLVYVSYIYINDVI